MSSLTELDLRFIARLVEHPRGRGYVLDFSDTTFGQFFRDEIGVDIDEDRWSREGGSKGKRLRYFLNNVNDKVALKTIKKIWQYRKHMLLDNDEVDPVPKSRERIIEIAKKLGYKPKASKPTAEQPGATQITLDETVASKLKQELINLEQLAPQSRGFAFERFLHELLEKSGCDPRPSFRNTGEQIDGSFSHQGEVYLLEAKWIGPAVSIAALHTFEGKVGSKAEWARGLFVSYSGFSEDAFKAFGSQRRIVCMDGSDLYEMLNQNIPFERVLDLKVRRAAETGRPFVPLREFH